MNCKRVMRSISVVLTVGFLFLLLSPFLAPEVWGALVQLKNDNNTAGGYSSIWQSGHIVGAVLTPEDYMYPVRVLSVQFVLYNGFPGADDSATVRVCIYSLDSGQPDAQLGCSAPQVITTFAPSLVSVSLDSSEIIIDSPDSFLAAVKYVSGVAGQTPSTLTDTSTGIPPGKNFYSLNSGSTWYEHYDFWAEPSQVGFNIIRATVDTNYDDDTEGPIIGSPSYPSSVLGDEPFDVTVGVSDQTTGDHGVLNATLRYGYTSPYDQNNISGSGPGGNGDGTWSFVIPAQGDGHEGQTLHFSLEACDNDDSPACSINDNQGSYFAVAILGRPSAAFTTSSPDWLGQATTFTNATTGQAPIDYTWSFGDGHTSTLENPTHLYAEPGIYTVTLTATNPAGSDVATDTVVIYGPPAADFTGHPTQGLRPLIVAFTDATTTVPPGDPTLIYLWGFGDGTTSTQRNPSHAYAVAGVYTVTLQASNAAGSDTRTRTDYVSVYEPVQAGFVASPTSGKAPLEVSFTNTSSGDYTTSQWSFGDGTTSDLPSPSHTYTISDSYTVTLTVSGPGGTDSEVKGAYITVWEEYNVYLPVVLRNP